MRYFRLFLRYAFVFDISKYLFNILLPARARRKISSGLDLDTGPENRPIEHIERIPIQANAYLAVYWKAYKQIIGPGVSLYVKNNEILRFDCSGEAHGHYHSLPCLAAYPSEQRIYFTEASIEAQVQRSSQELIKSSASHLRKHFHRSIRDFKLDQSLLQRSVAKSSARMLEYQLFFKNTAPNQIDKPVFSLTSI